MAWISTTFPMSFSQPRHTPTEVPNSGPEAHEDLTIAEQIETMRLESADCPGESCFMNSRGKKCWIANGVVERFVRKLGSIHPSDYRAVNGVEWQSLFFRGI
jgi:hypothetical protein